MRRGGEDKESDEREMRSGRERSESRGRDRTPHGNRVGADEERSVVVEGEERKEGRRKKVG